MSAAQLGSILQAHIDLSDALNLAMNGDGYASLVEADNDLEKNALYEGYFMRAFISFESSLEAIFLHYACGGQSMAGNAADSRLTKCDPEMVRRILRQGGKYIDWANPEVVRERSSIFFVDGKPFYDALVGKSEELSQIQKIRNRISHDSAEARIAYSGILVPLFSTKPLFDMSPGQLLRVKRRRKPAISLHAHYLAAMTDVLRSVCEKI